MAQPSSPGAHESPSIRHVRVPSLDGLRGFAVLLVLFSHASNIGVWLGPWFDCRGVGRYGVFLFFVLSAYLLTRQFLELAPAAKARPRTWLNYFLRRFLRIVPAYVACLIVYVIARSWPLERAGLHALFLRGEDHFWAIPVEIGFYFLLPVFIALTSLVARRSSLLAALALAAVAVALRLAFAPDYGAVPPDFRPAFWPFVPIFLAGSCVAVAEHWYERAVRASLRERLRLPFELLALASLALVVAHAPSLAELRRGVPVEGTHYHLDFDRFAVLWAVFLFTLLHGRGWLRACFEARGLRFVGLVSYSTYLLHELVLEAVARFAVNWPDPVPFLVFLCFALSSGWASFRLFEKPLMGVRLAD